MAVNEKYQYQVQVRSSEWVTVEVTSSLSLAKAVARDIAGQVRIWNEGESVWSSIDGDGYRVR